MGRVAVSPVQRFWPKVQKTETCWLWTAAIDIYGYGAFRVSTRNTDGMVRAHRFSYETVVGAIPEGLQLDHLCRVRNCVNPAHLEPVTSAENTRRGVAHHMGPAPRTHCPHGHEYTEANTTYRKDRKSRRCRTCHNQSTSRAARAARTRR